MGYIYSLNSQKIGHIDDKGEVFDTSDHHLGKVASDGHVLTVSGNMVGHLDGSGRVFEDSRHVGTVRGDGSIVDLNGHRLGHADPPHAEFGGAALLLLIR